MPVQFTECTYNDNKCNCEVALAFSGDPDHVARVGRCNSNDACRNYEVTNIYDENACNQNKITSRDQAFNQSFWNNPNRNKALRSDWLDCASLGDTTHFVNFLN
jgi:hypothetical protein